MLAGGRSTRMGRDKALLPLGGRSLLERALELLRSAGFRPAVAGLRTPVASSAPCIPDLTPDAGPLGGMEAALRSLAGGHALFIPVDLPLLPACFLEALFRRAERSGARATVPYADGRPQPLCAVYGSSLAPGIQEALRHGDRKVMRVIAGLAPGSEFDRFRVEALAPLYGWEAPHRWFWNVNTPGELQTVDALLHPFAAPEAAWRPAAVREAERGSDTN